MPDRDYTQGKRVLILIPHQDDEINVAGGILSSLNNTKDVFVAFSTNGDYRMAQINDVEQKCVRLREAINALGIFGIPEDHIIFMGYGDQWLPSGTDEGGEHILHLYHAPADMLMTSHARMKETYSLSSHPCFHERQPYTKASFYQDLRDIILQIKADSIICVDYDTHPDHRALSLAFEHVLGEVMKHDETYRPVVLKVFAYSTAWLSSRVYNRLNIASTPAPNSSSYMKEVNYYRWADRIRFPLSTDCITRSVYDNPIYRALLCHRTQLSINGAAFCAGRILKGDKVAWWRPTDNLLLRATVHSDEGNAESLHDFTIVDTDNVCLREGHPFQHGWFVKPESANEATFRLASPEKIREIWLYDHPSDNNQIQEVTIEFSNGKVLRTQALPSNGSPLCVQTYMDDVVEGFKIKVDKFTGENAGLAEVEAYSQHPSYPAHYVKMMDETENFIYDYATPPDGKLIFSCYSPCPEYVAKVYVRMRESSSREISLSQLGGNLYKLMIPKGESCILEVRDKETETLLDVARVQNMGRLTRLLLEWKQSTEMSRVNQIYNKMKVKFREKLSLFQ